MAAVRHFDWGFLGVWNGIAVFFTARALQSSWRAVGHHMLGGKQRSRGSGQLVPAAEMIANHVLDEGTSVQTEEQVVDSDREPGKTTHASKDDSNQLT